MLRTLVIGGFAAGAWLLGGAAAQAATAGPAVESHSTGGAVVSLVNGLGSGAVEPQTPTTSARTSADPTRRSTPLTGPTRRDNAGRPADRNTSGLLPTTVPTGLVPADAVRVPLDVLRAPVDAAATPVIDPLANQLAGHPGSGTLHHADRAATAAPGGSDGTVRGLVHHLAAALRPVDAPASGSLRPVATLVRPVVDPVVRALRPVTVPRHHAVRSVTVTPSPATTATTGRPGTANQVDPRPSAVDADPVGVSSHARASSAATSSRDLTAPAIRPARAGAAGTGHRQNAGANLGPTGTATGPGDTDRTPQRPEPAPLRGHLGAASGIPGGATGSAGDGGSVATLASSVADSTVAHHRLSIATGVAVRRYHAEAPTVSPD